MLKYGQDGKFYVLCIFHNLKKCNEKKIAHDVPQLEIFLC